MNSNKSDPGDVVLANELVAHYDSNRALIRRFLGSLDVHITDSVNDGKLQSLVHSTKSRLKNPDHLRHKLLRKMREARQNGSAFQIDRNNLFTTINDLGGYRILHLHSGQVEGIHNALLEIIDDAQFDLFEPPFAHIWDEESRIFYADIGISIEVNPRMYSSVHYVIKPRGKDMTLEVQVRTLADEIWGEVDHKINYPDAHPSAVCREQIRVLARVASACSRLVDSIMIAHNEWRDRSSDPPTITSGESDSKPD